MIIFEITPKTTLCKMELSLLESLSFKRRKSEFGLWKLKTRRNGLKRQLTAALSAGK